MRTHLLLTVISTLVVPALTAQNIQPPYSNNYSYVDLGPAPGVPGNYGGVAFKVGEPNVLYIGGHAARAPGAVYRVSVTRDANGHITGFAGTASRFADAPNIDGGLQFGPGGVLFFTRYNQNELGQVAPGSTTMNKSVPLYPFGVLYSVGALSFIPAGHPRAGDLKLVSFTHSIMYTATLVPDGSGTYDVGSMTTGPRIGGGPEGFLHVSPDSPHFTNFQYMIASDWSAGEIAIFHLDAAGEPEPATRQVFMNGVNGCEGAALDPISGDFVFSTYGSANRVLAVRGFGTPCGRILHNGRATAGTGGIAPALTSRGCFARRETVSLEVSDGLGGAVGVLLAGLQGQSLPLFGVEVLVVPSFPVPHILTGASGAPGQGTFSTTLDIPDQNNLLGIDFFFQSIYLDPAAPFGLSATDGIQLNVR